MKIIDRRTGQSKKDEEGFVAIVGELGSQARIAVGTGTKLLPTREEICATLTSEGGPPRKGATRVGEHIARE